MLVQNWPRVIKRFWSFRLAILSALLSAAEVGIQFYQPSNIAPGAFAFLAAVISLAAAVSRIVAQPKAYQNDK